MPYSDPAAQKAAQQKHYADNKGKYAESSRIAREKKRAKLQELKSGPCTDCGVSYPYYVMQFDHIADNKEFNIGKMMHKVSWQKILEEIAKCELVCANCHAERTHQRLQ